MCREMKESRIPFCGAIPEDWSEIPNRYLFNEHSVKVGKESDKYQLLSLTKAGVKTKDINDTVGKIPASYENYQTVENGDMIFCLFDLDCSAVFSGLSAHDGMITSAYVVARPEEQYLDPKFADYWFQYVFSNRYYMMYSKSIRYTVSSDMFKTIHTLIPPLEVQEKIGNILDEDCKKINMLILNQEQQIEKLKAYKQSLITEVVTKGLNPDVEMKDSGVDWIGYIPKQWKIIRGKAVLENLSRKVEPDMEVITCFRDGEVTLRKNRREEGFTFSDKEIGYQGIYPGDLVVHGMDGFAGAIGISDSKGKGSPVLIVCDSNENKTYLMYYLRNLAYRDIFLALSTGIRVRSCDLRWNKISVLPFIVPPIEEQNRIVEHLNEKCVQVDTLIRIKQSKIQKLNEYKKSLIYEYVTGKKQVI